MWGSPWYSLSYGGPWWKKKDWEPLLSGATLKIIFNPLCCLYMSCFNVKKTHRNTNELLTQSVFVVRVHVCVSSHPLAWSDPCSCEMFLSYVRLHIWMGRGRARWVQLTSGSRGDNGGRASIGRTKQRPPGSWPLRWEGLGYGIW